MEPWMLVVLAVATLGGGGAFGYAIAMWRQRAVVQQAADAAREAVQREADADIEKIRRAAEIEQRKVAELAGEVRVLQERLKSADRDYQTQLDAERRRIAEKEALLGERLSELQDQSKATFEALAARTLKDASEQFMKRAEQTFGEKEKLAKADIDKRQQAIDSLIKPIGEVLGQTREKLEAIEKSRAESFAALHQRMDLVTQAGQGLREETNKLTRALSRPEVRGQYGEIQLRRVAELAGMTSYCDFSEQASERNEDGELLRPDMVVTLPNDRVIAVDAKTNTYAYIEAVNAEDDAERQRHLERFAKHVAEQTKKLADKKYWSLWRGSPEFVVMFVPGDHFIDAALARRPDLIDDAAQRGVILASPSTLIGLLRAVAVGWREHKLAEEAQALFELGRELHDRAAVAFEHAADLGKSLKQASERYNKLVGSLDRRLAPTLRKFEEVGAKSSKVLAEPKPIDGPERLIEAKAMEADN
ncbi:MAG: DNA recombination protein RmuC [Planctomycetota bacterium]